MDVDLNKWYRANIDKKEFKKLCKKSDWQGFKHMFIYFSALFISGYLAYITWGTWWCVLFFFIVLRRIRSSSFSSRFCTRRCLATLF